MTARRWSRILGCGLPFVLVACASPHERLSEPEARPVFGPAEKTVLEVRNLGVLEWFDGDTGRGVLRIYAAVAPAPGERVVTRDSGFRPTAYWEVLALRAGKSMGLRLLEGKPTPGEIITSLERMDPDSSAPGS